MKGNKLLFSGSERRTLNEALEVPAAFSGTWDRLTASDKYAALRLCGFYSGVAYVQQDNEFIRGLNVLTWSVFSESMQPRIVIACYELAEAGFSIFSNIPKVKQRVAI